MEPTEPHAQPQEDNTIMSLSGSGGAISLDQDLPSGTRIGKYQVKRLLGRGGMGAVYEAADTILHRAVALKILPQVLTGDKQSLARFIREAQLAARLNHPNAVTVYDVGRKGGVYFIAMELVRGVSGEDILRSGKRLSVAEATGFVADACRALVAAHGAGLIHRDIKPANILRANDGTVKLTDFGLAKLHAAGEMTMSHKDVVLGTPKYMSPEQAQNETVDGRTDLYALGATYYALLTGAAPFDEGTTMQILYAHCTKPVPDPRQIAQDVPEACARIIQKAMAKKPSQRYATARDMLDDLEAVLGRKSVGDETQADFTGLIAALGKADPSADDDASGPSLVAARDGMAMTPAAGPPGWTAWAARPVMIAGLVGGVAVLLITVGALATLTWALTRPVSTPPPNPTPNQVAASPAAPPHTTTEASAVATPTPVHESSPLPEPEPIPEIPPTPAAALPVAAAPPPAEALPPEEAPVPLDREEAERPPRPEDDPVYARYLNLKGTAEQAHADGNQRALALAVRKLTALHRGFHDSTEPAKRRAAEEARQTADSYRSMLPQRDDQPRGKQSPPNRDDRRPPRSR